MSISASAQVKSSNGLVKSSVEASRGAIGFVSLDFVDSDLRTVNYQGVGCTLRNAKSNQYKGVRPFSLVTRGKPTGAAKAFIKWVQTSAAAKADHQPALDPRSVSALSSRRRGAPRRPPERAELWLGALAATLLLLIAGMLAFVFKEAWPSFSHNGLAWFGSGGNTVAAAGGDLRVAFEPGRVRLPPARLAAAVRDDAEHRARRPDRPPSRCSAPSSWSSSRRPASSA